MLKEKCKDCILFIEKERVLDKYLDSYFCNVIGCVVNRNEYSIDCMNGMIKKDDEEL